MKTTLDLPEELMREVKIRAVVQGRTVKDLVADFLRQGLGLSNLGKEDSTSSNPWIRIGKGGLPQIQCNSAAPAAHMTVHEILAIEQECQSKEDLQRVGLSV